MTAASAHAYAIGWMDTKETPTAAAAASKDSTPNDEPHESFRKVLPLLKAIYNKAWKDTELPPQIGYKTHLRMVLRNDCYTSPYNSVKDAHKLCSPYRCLYETIIRIPLTVPNIKYTLPYIKTGFVAHSSVSERHWVLDYFGTISKIGEPCSRKISKWAGCVDRDSLDAMHRSTDISCVVFTTWPHLKWPSVKSLSAAAVAAASSS
jgi:hypothetical protein